MTNNGVLRHIKVGSALLLCTLQLLLVLLSWILAAAFPELSVRSLLSSEGIRWFLGNFTDNMQTPVLVWLLVGSVAYGALRDSKMPHALRECLGKERLPYRKRLALSLVLFEFVVCVAVMFLLAGIPHAILLSVTGNLFPSSFSNSIIPVTAFCLSLFAVTFGTISGMQKTAEDVFSMLTSGISYTLPLWLIYILGAQLYFSLLFVFPDFPHI